MNGFAIKIELMEWQKHDGRYAIFRQLKSHYVGSFSRETGERAYQKLDKYLNNLRPDRHPTKAAKNKRS